MPRRSKRTESVDELVGRVTRKLQRRIDNASDAIEGAAARLISESVAVAARRTGKIADELEASVREAFDDLDKILGEDE